MLKCDACNGTNFTPSEGNFFCKDCGLQTHDQHEYDFEEYTQVTQDRTFKNIKIKESKPDKIKSDTILTTWEEYNYILLGLVNELVELGAKPSLKLTTLQLWTAYLRAFKVAFFSEDPLEMPRLGPQYKKKDAKVIYNRKVVKIPKKRAMEPDTVLCRDEPSRKKSKRNKTLAAVEYEAYKEFDPDGQMLDTIGPTPTKDCEALPVQFSEPAKKIFDWLVDNKKMLQSPVEKPPVGELLLKTIARNGRYNNAIYGSVSRRILYTIIYMALNQNRDDIQLSDFLRYIREGHISFAKVKHLLPEHLHTADDDINVMFCRSEQASLANVDFRRQVSELCHVVQTSMIVPDMKRLVQRFLEELCLPQQLFDIIEQLMVLFPPDLKYSRDNSKDRPVSNYEGRACAYIMFALKLLFGLDDQQEQAISATSADVNNTMGSDKPLFVWSEWVEFTELRKCILAQCHYPSNLLYTDCADHSLQLYTEFCTKMQGKYQDVTTPKPKQTKHLQTVNHLVDRLWQEHNASAVEVPSFKFEASLTPTRSYFDEILQNSSVATRFIPPAAKIDHSKRRIDHLVDPEAFQRQCREQGYDIRIEPAATNKNVKFVPIFKPSPSVTPAQTHFYRYDTEIDEADWLEEVEERRNQLKINKKLTKEVVQKDIEERRQVEEIGGYGKKTRKYYEKKIMKKHSQLSTSNEISIKASSPSKQQDVVDQNSPENLKELTMVTSNFEYWLHLMVSSNKLYYAEFRQLENQLPSNFRWLLNHIATMLEMEARDLYVELTTIETHFCYVYQPKKRIRNTIVNHCTGKIKHDLVSRIRFAKKRW